MKRMRSNKKLFRGSGKWCVVVTMLLLLSIVILLLLALKSLAFVYLPLKLQVINEQAASDIQTEGSNVIADSSGINNENPSWTNVPPRSDSGTTDSINEATSSQDIEGDDIKENYEPNRDQITEAIRLILTAIGAVSVVLTYINSAKSIQIVGFSTQTIIEARYPFRIWFFIGQGVFVLLGIFASASNIQSTALLCLSGAFICLIYSVVMAIQITYSERHIYKCVRAYIDKCNADDRNIIRKENGMTAMQCYNSHLMDLICHIARHLNSRFRNRELVLTEEKTNGIDFCYLVGLINRIQPYTGAERAMPEECDCVSIFNCVFSSDSDINTDWQKAVFYDIPAVRDNTELFIRCVIGCREMWELLLEGITEIEQKAGIAHHVLCVAANNCINIPVLICGLISYLRLNLDPRRENKNTTSTCNYSYFLRILSYGRAQPSMMDYEISTQSKRKCNRIIGEIAIIMLCLYVLEWFFLGEEEGNYSANHQFEKDISQVCTDRFFHGRDSYRYYLTYAWLLFRGMNLCARALPAQIERQLAWQELLEEIDRQISQTL